MTSWNWIWYRALKLSELTSTHGRNHKVLKSLYFRRAVMNLLWLLSIEKIRHINGIDINEVGTIRRVGYKWQSIDNLRRNGWFTLGLSLWVSFQHLANLSLHFLIILSSPENRSCHAVDNAALIWTPSKLSLRVSWDLLASGPLVGIEAESLLLCSGHDLIH